MTTVAIHQPGYLPWLGFFKKMQEADVFVYFDDVKFVRNNYYNRNIIKTANGPIWLTVPVLARSDSLINDVRIDSTKHWRSKHSKSIQLEYKDSKFFDEYAGFFEELYGREFDRLIDVNLEIIEFFKKQFGIGARMVRSSELDPGNNTPDRILEICRAMDATRYVSGTVWARDHLDVEKFEESGISVEFKEFHCPAYDQLHGEFLPNMSAIDLLFNEGGDGFGEITDGRYVRIGN